MEVPRYDQTTVQPGVIPTPRMSGASPVGQALEQLGGTVGGIANEAQQFALHEKQKADESMVLDTVVQHTQALQDIEQVGLQRKGKDSFDTKQVLDLYDQEYKKFAGGLKNETQQLLFKRHTAEDRNRLQLALERHASGERMKLDQGNASALVQLKANDLSRSYEDDRAFDPTNARSPFNALIAAKKDELHLHGVAEGSELWTAEIDKVRGAAYADRIKQVMVDNPSKAALLFDEYKNHLSESDREHLKSAVQKQSDEKEGIDSAFALTDLIGTKNETDLEKMLHDKLKDKPGAFKVAKAQLNDLIHKVHDDRLNQATDLGEKIEASLDQAVGTGKTISPAYLQSMGEYQELVKLGHKEANGVLAKVRSYLGRMQHQQKQERDALDRERRRDRKDAERDRKLEQLELMAAYDDPDTLINTTDSAIKDTLSPHIGYINAKKLVNLRHKYMKDNDALQKAKIDKDIMVEEMEGADLKYQVSPSKMETEDFKRTAKLKNRVAQLIRYEQETTGKAVTPERQREIIRSQLLKVHVTRLSKWRPDSVEKMQFEAAPESYEIPGASSEDVGMVVARYRQRGIEPDYKMVEAGVAALQR